MGTRRGGEGRRERKGQIGRAAKERIHAASSIWCMVRMPGGRRTEAGEWHARAL